MNKIIVCKLRNTNKVIGCKAEQSDNGCIVARNENDYHQGALSKGAKLITESGTTRILSGTFYAHHGATYQSWYRVNSETNKVLLSSLTEDYKAYSGIKRMSKLTRDTLNACIANAVYSARTKTPIVYSRNTADSDIKVLINVVDFMAYKGLVNNVVGKANEYQNNSSWFVSTPKFSLEVERERIKVEFAKDASFLILRDGEKNEIAIKKTRKNRLELQALSAPIQAYNHTWLKHSATLEGRELLPFSVRIFNRDLSLGGRWYRGQYQNLPKADRVRILIDDCNTIEPDFKALHYALLYAMVGIDMFSLFDDPYSIDGYSRNTIKLASLVLLNSSDLARFKANVTKSGNPKLIELFKTDPNHISLEGFIGGMPEGIDGADLLQALKAKHAPIAHMFGSKDIGLKLQRLDSDILSSAVHSLTALNIPVLPVHDSIRCRVVDKKAVVNTMVEAFKQHTGFTPIIDF